MRFIASKPNQVRLEFTHFFIFLANNDYFMNSGDKIRFFFDPAAFDDQKNLKSTAFTERVKILNRSFQIGMTISPNLATKSASFSIQTRKLPKTS